MEQLLDPSQQEINRPYTRQRPRAGLLKRWVNDLNFELSVNTVLIH